MRTAAELLFKFIAVFIASWISFGIIDGNPINMIFIAALAGTVINYLLGDFIILPSMGKAVTFIEYGVLTAVTAYVIDLFSYSFSTSATSLIINAVIVAAAEYLFHFYLTNDEKSGPNEFHKEPPME